MLDWNIDAVFGRPREDANLGTVLFVDPGLEGTGLAYWLDFNRVGPRGVPPFAHHAIHPSTGLEWPQKFGVVMRGFTMLLKSVEPDLVVIESQAVWTSSPKSVSSASSGNLLKLVMLTGAMAGECNHQHIAWSLVDPNTWKGQLPKQALKSRVREALGYSYPEHVWDAVGMGLASKEEL